MTTTISLLAPGATPGAIFQAQSGNSYTETLTDNYQKLFVSGRHQANQISLAVVESVSTEGMFGTLLRVS